MSLIFSLIFLVTSAGGVDLSENQVSDKIVQMGVIVPKNSIREYTLPDDSRVDIFTDEYAFEVEWAHKWKESIGQSLYYAIQTDKKPGIILLFKGEPQDKENYLRCSVVCEKYNIKLITLKVKDLK